MGLVDDFRRVPEVIKEYPVLAAAASFWEPGLGQILCGKIERGVYLLFPRIAFQLYFFLGGTSYVRLGLFSISVNVAFSLLTSALKIWATYDAYQIARELRKSEP